MSEQQPLPFDQSPSIGALAAALAKAQGEMSSAKKDSTNPHFKSKYADLASVWDACRAALSKNGLSVVQRVSMRADGVAVKTRLMHASGEWLEDELVVPIAQRTAQSIGSSITYARRYALAAITGVAADDDDGNEATAAAPKDEGRREAPRQIAAKQSRTDEAKEKLAKLATPAAWQKIVELGALYGMTEAQMVLYCKDPLAGKTRSQLGDDDVRKIQDALSKTGQAVGAPA
jgi:hypothetical protein